MKTSLMVACAEVMAGLQAWSDYQTEHEFPNSTFLFAPIYGESNNEYSFKLVQNLDDYAAVGAVYELMGNGGHWQKQQERLDPLMNCDVARVYDVHIVRGWSEAD